MSGDPLQRARRMAQRTRAAIACPPCKASKAKCSDYRPCARCKKAGGDEICLDLCLESRKSFEGTNGSSASYCKFDQALDARSTNVRPYFNANFGYQTPPMAVLSSRFPAFPICKPEAVYTWNDTMEIDLTRGRGWVTNGDEGSLAQLGPEQVGAHPKHSIVTSTTTRQSELALLSRAIAINDASPPRPPS
jgi:hypothetical protein